MKLQTVPIRVASGERQFSKLKLRENYLRLPISQEHFSSLSLVLTEN